MFDHGWRTINLLVLRSQDTELESIFYGVKNERSDNNHHYSDDLY